MRRNSRGQLKRVVWYGFCGMLERAAGLLRIAFKSWRAPAL
jgi:hypothetical protein